MPDLAEKAVRRSWVELVPVLLLLGGTVGPTLDGIHTFSGTTAYAEVWILKMAWWVPMLFAGAGLGFGAAPLIWDAAFKRPAKVPSSARIAVSVALFVGSYLTSGFFKTQGFGPAALLFVVFAVSWWLCDRTALGLLLSLGAGLSGSAVEALLVHNGLFWYHRPDVLGIPLWLPVLYFSAQVAVSNVARRIAYGAPAIQPAVRTVP